MNKRIPELKVLEWHDTYHNIVMIIVSLITFLAPVVFLFIPFENTAQYGMGFLILTMGSALGLWLIIQIIMDIIEMIKTKLYNSIDDIVGNNTTLSTIILEQRIRELEKRLKKDNGKKNAK